MKRSIFSLGILALALACNNNAVDPEELVQGPGAPQSCFESSVDGSVICEANGLSSDADVDGDGEEDTFLCPDGDEDGDDVADFQDDDDDGDGVADEDEDADADDDADDN